MRRSGLSLVLVAASIVVLVALSLVLPVSYVVLSPGPTCDTLTSCDHQQVVIAKGVATYPSSGSLNLTTVDVQPASCTSHPSLFAALRAWFDPHEAVQPKQSFCPPGQTSEEVLRQNEAEMEQSQQDAVTAALLYLGYKPASEHVSVKDVIDGTPAARVLQPADVIVAVDGKPANGLADLQRLVSAHPVGSKVSVTIERSGHRMTVNTQTISNNATPPRPILGIDADITATFPKLNVRIGLNPADIGGPSAGLMFTLGIIDQLTPADLTGGHTIAGTGTIDGFGRVGPIGGIQQKIAAASGHGPHPVHASVFLVPATECADAKAAAPASMTLVKVDTLRTAVDALHAIAAGRSDFPRC
jgi:PDZ domain-containing protein